MFLKQSTAVTIKLGPFSDSVDGVTAETGLTIQKANVRLSKNGGDMAAANANQGEADAGAAHDEIGYYDISLDATDTNTLGRLAVMVSMAGALPVWMHFDVITANAWALLCDTGNFAGSVASVTGAVGSVTGAVGSVTGAVGSVTAGVSLANDAITAAKFDESTAFPVKSADTGATILARGDTFKVSVGTGAGQINASSGKVPATVAAGDIATDAITAAAVKADAVTKIQTGLALEATLTAIKGAGWSTETLAAIDALIDAIKAKTDLIPASPSTLDAAGVRTAVGMATANLDAQLAALAAYVDAEIGQILGATAGKKIVNAAGTQVAVYDRAGALLVTLDRTGTGPYTWTPTWA